jgi:acetyltransferase
MSIRHLRALFQPKSIAFIDGSDEPGSVSSAVIHNILLGGFKGLIMPVTPRHQAVAGILAYPDPGSLPVVPDLAIIFSPPQSVPKSIAQLGELGTRAALVFTAGLTNAWDDGHGRNIQEAMLEAAEPYDLRILGPSSQGLLVPGIGLNASFALQSALSGKIALVSQSGAICNGVLDWTQTKGIGFSHVISLGDCADVGFDDVLDYLCTDPNTRAILLYIETISHGRRFMSAARAAARNKLLLAIKAGGPTQSIRPLPACMDSVAGSDQVYEAALRRAGILRVFDIEELFAAVETLGRTGPPKSGRLALVTNCSGMGNIAVDALGDDGGATLAQLSTETMEKLDGVLPATWSRGNPVDIVANTERDSYSETLRILLRASEVDAVLAMYTPTALGSSTSLAETVIRIAREHPGPILTCWFGGEAVAKARRLFSRAGIPSYESPATAARAFSHIVNYRRSQELLMQTPRTVPVEFRRSTDVAATAIGKVLASGQETITDPEAKSVLRAYEIPTVVTRFACDPVEAAALGSSVGFPVAIKLLCSGIENQFGNGGLALDLNTSKAVQEAAWRLITRLHESFPNGRFLGFSVWKMERRPKAHKLAIGMTTDPAFGPILAMGQGGSAASTSGDFAVTLPPLNMHLAWELISRTRVYKVLTGHWGHGTVAIDAICLTLVKLSQLIIDNPNIIELQINPLLVDQRGVLVIETCIGVNANPMPVSERLAIRPYPQELEENFTLETGCDIRLRPIRPEDEPQYRVLASTLSSQDLRFRFFGYVGELPHEEMAHLTQIDYEREMAFIATASDQHGNTEMFGEVRAMIDADNTIAEFSIVVRGDLRGMGLGRRLMEKMIDYCRGRGTRKLIGYVLRKNRAMLSVAEAMAFRRKSVPNEPESFEISLDL